MHNPTLQKVWTLISSHHIPHWGRGTPYLLSSTIPGVHLPCVYINKFIITRTLPLKLHGTGLVQICHTLLHNPVCPQVLHHVCLSHLRNQHTKTNINLFIPISTQNIPLVFTFLHHTVLHTVYNLYPHTTRSTTPVTSSILSASIKQSLYSICTTYISTPYSSTANPCIMLETQITHNPIT